mgnify:CR=1 FL=1
MKDERLTDLENVDWHQPAKGVDQRHDEIKEKLDQFIDIFDRNSEDKSIVENLKKMKEELQ